MVNDRSKYDRRGQLLSVCDADGRTLESYRYDAAGNIVDKRVLGVHTEYTYDAANQLVKSVTNGVVTNYAYDAAGRMIKEGNREYSYSGLDKVDEIRENGKVIASYSYHTDGQLAVANYGNGKSEEFTWDGLALIGRNEVGYLNEPSVTGGNPISANGQTMFNDMLGSTLGISNGKNFSRTVMTSFGAYGDESSFYTGKPKVDGLGYTFNYRNYRADQGKWQTADPLGYPDGFNNYAYVNNGVTDKIDYLGLETIYDDLDPSSIVITDNRALSATNKPWGYCWKSSIFTDANGNECRYVVDILVRHLDWHIVDKLSCGEKTVATESSAQTERVLMTTTETSSRINSTVKANLMSLGAELSSDFTVLMSTSMSTSEKYNMIVTAEAGWFTMREYYQEITEVKYRSYKQTGNIVSNFIITNYEVINTSNIAYVTTRGRYE